MQIANITVALWGDAGGTTVPMYDVTVSEIAVLMALHGNGAVFDIEPTGEIERTDRDEIRRLHETYARARMMGSDGSDVSVLGTLFPGAAARAFRSFDELELDPSAFKATARMTAPTEKKPTKTTKQSGKAAKADPAPAPKDEPDQIGDMPDDGPTMFD